MPRIRTKCGHFRVRYVRSSGFMPDGIQIGAMTQWILSCPNTAVQKAILFGACGGAFAAAMRSWLSLDKNVE